MPEPGIADLAPSRLRLRRDKDTFSCSSYSSVRGYALVDAVHRAQIIC